MKSWYVLKRGMMRVHRLVMEKVSTGGSANTNGIKWIYIVFRVHAEVLNGRLYLVSFTLSVPTS